MNSAIDQLRPFFKTYQRTELRDSAYVRAAVLMLIFWFGLQLISGLAVRGSDVTGGVAFWAHVGGFVAGMMLIVPFKKRRVRLFQ